MAQVLICAVTCPVQGPRKYVPRSDQSSESQIPISRPLASITTYLIIPNNVKACELG